MKASRAYAPPRLSTRGLSIVLVLHLLALWGLARREPIGRPAPLGVLSVSLLPTTDAPAPAPSPVERPKSRPIEKPAPVRPLAALALPNNAPVDSPATSQPVLVPPPDSALALPPDALAPPAPAPVASPTPPRFDALYLDNPKPAYPTLARRLGEEGRVVLRVRVAANGLPDEVALHSSSASSRLDQSALDTVRRWKFVPARIGGEPIAASVLVPIVFSLKE